MLYYFMAMLLAAVVVGLSNYRSEVNRWAAFFLVSAAIGGLTSTLRTAGADGWATAAEFLNLVLTPYGVLVFSIVYSEQVAAVRTRGYLKGLLLLPAVVTICVTPFTPQLNMDYGLLLAWSGPYYLISCYLLIVSLWKEQDRHKKRSRFITTIIIVPTLLAVLGFINMGRVLEPNFDFSRYIFPFIVYSLAIAALFTFVYGVLGVKLRFERDPLESTIKAVSSGTAMLNHTIKNELGKIAISTDNLAHSLAAADQESQRQLQIIENASSHMMAMVTRIHSQMKEIVLLEQPERLDLLAQQCLQQYRQLLLDRKIASVLVAPEPLVVRCDAVHMREVIGNIIMNAVEAMPGGGKLEVRLTRRKRIVRLSFYDNGTGIAKARMNRVFEPFFSTKNHTRNFGLGLSYVYNVMRLSGGSVELSSEEGKGAVLALVFPKAKLLLSG
ncbi:histidine kinase [Paenibacillaceae bacterium]|nr:histidine kinase [Paenibacillaceae bacterium]